MQIVRARHEDVQVAVLAVSQSAIVTQDKTRCSTTGTLPKRAPSGKPSEKDQDADGVRSLREKCIPHP